MLYADTALNGDVAATGCGHAFFGTSSCLFATDAPFDAEQGRGLIRNTIKAIEALPITAGRREMISPATRARCSSCPQAETMRATAREIDGTRQCCGCGTRRGQSSVRECP